MGEFRYRDSEGSPRTLEWMCKHEPEWAANRIRQLEYDLACALERRRPEFLLPRDRLEVDDAEG